MIEQAKALLKSSGASLALVKGDTQYTCFMRGVAPMLYYIQQGISLQGFSAADKVVGRAAALLFAYAGVADVYAELLSVSAVKILDLYKISYSYGRLIATVINREGNGICPMETATADISEAESGYAAIQATLEKLKKEKE